MRNLAILLALLSTIIGVLLLAAPKTLIKLGEQTNRLYNIDGVVYRNRFIFGGLLFLAGFFLIYTTL